MLCGITEPLFEGGVIDIITLPIFASEPLNFTEVENAYCSAYMEFGVVEVNGNQLLEILNFK